MLSKKILYYPSEFVMAEIEHYVDPLDKNHPRFGEVSDQKLKLLPKTTQLDGRTDLQEQPIGEAVSQVWRNADNNLFNQKKKKKKMLTCVSWLL